MSSITLGDVTLTAQDDSIRIDIAGQAASATLSSRDIATLERFLGEARNGESRTGFRLPIQSMLQQFDGDLKITLLHQGTIYDAQCIDLSLTGMLVRCSSLELVRRTRLNARLLFDDYLARLDAEVARVDGALIALHFTSSLAGGELNPPTDLLPIFSRLEQAFLRNR